MYLKESIAKDIWNWPTLFKDYNLQNSELKVLDHYFLVIGNGFEWHDGYLANDELLKCHWRKNKINITDGPKYGKERFDSKKIDVKYFTGVEVEKLEIEKFTIHLPKENVTSWKPSQHSNNSCIINIPKDVRIDWLAGASKIFRSTYEYYQSHPNWIEEANYNEYQTKRITESLSKSEKLIGKMMKKKGIKFGQEDEVINSCIN